MSKLSKTNAIKLLAMALSAISLSACATPSQVYWDHKVKDLCEKDGGVTVYEKVELTKEEYDALPKNNGLVSVPVKELVQKNQGFFAETKDTVLNQADPYVWRTDVSIKRKSDDKAIAKYSTFHRRGGDIPDGISHPSFYRCPDPKLLTIKVSEIFSIKGE